MLCCYNVCKTVTCSVSYDITTWLPVTLTIRSVSIRRRYDSLNCRRRKLPFSWIHRPMQTYRNSWVQHASQGIVLTKLPKAKLTFIVTWVVGISAGRRTQRVISAQARRRGVQSNAQSCTELPLATCPHRPCVWSPSIMVPPVTSATVAGRAFSVAAPPIWNNSLPADVAANLPNEAEKTFVSSIVSWLLLLTFYTYIGPCSDSAT